MLILYSSVNAQGFHFSVHYAASFLSLNGWSEIEIAPLTNFAFSTQYYFNKSNAIDVRAGYIHLYEVRLYSGPDIGLYYHLLLLPESKLENKLYIFTGVKAHTGTLYKPCSRTAFFAVGGFGIPLGKIVSLEIIYNKAIKNRYYEESRIFYEIDLGLALRLERIN